MSTPSQPVESLLARLEGVKNQGGFYRAFCLAHDDRITPNLDTKEGEDGRVLLLCRAGCSTEEVIDALGLKMRDLFSSGGHGGATFEERLATSSVRERLYLVRLAGAEDVSDLHIQDPERCMEVLRAAFRGARRWAEEARAQAEARDREA